MSRIAQTAVRVPWEAPQNLYEALATLAFLRTAIGTLEGIGPNTFGRLDGSQMAAGSVLNIMLPTRIPLDRCVAFLRAVATTATASLQLNCVSKETLLDAQVHPENYPDLIVRVTGFSAKFVSLSKGWQDEIITRNFYD